MYVCKYTMFGHQFPPLYTAPVFVNPCFYQQNIYHLQALEERLKISTVWELSIKSKGVKMMRPHTTDFPQMVVQ